MSLFLITPNDVPKSCPSFDASHHMSDISIEELKLYEKPNIDHILVPKFKIQSTIDLRSVTDRVSHASGGTKVLEHIAETPNLIPDKFIQRTSIEINEEGVRAITMGTNFQIYFQLGIQSLSFVSLTLCILFKMKFLCIFSNFFIG